MPNTNDLQHGLDQLTETTTAADLVRRRGQHQRLKTISEKKLLEWMQRAIERQFNQTLASRQDNFSDEEKRRIQEQTLASVQHQLQQFKDEQQKAQGRIAEMQQRYNEAVQAAEGNQELQEALANLQEQANRAEQRASERQQDLFELEDRFNENAQLLNTTIAEKEKLAHTNRELLLKGSAVVQEVLDIDHHSYGEHHSADYAKRNIEHEPGKEFYADFEIASLVLTTLRDDLTRLHKLAHTFDQEAARPIPQAEKMTHAPDGTQRFTYDSSKQAQTTIAGDLAIIEHLQSGTLGGQGAIDADQAQLLIRIADTCINKVPSAGGEDLEESDSPRDPGDILQVKLHKVLELFSEQLARNRDLVEQLNAGSEEQISLREEQRRLQEQAKKAGELEELADTAKEMIPLLNEKITRLEGQLKEEREARRRLADENTKLNKRVWEAADAEQRLVEALSGFQEVIGDPAGSPVAKTIARLQGRLNEMPELETEEDAEPAPIRPHLLEDLANDGIAVINALVQEHRKQQQQQEQLGKDLASVTNQAEEHQQLAEKYAEANHDLLQVLTGLTREAGPTEADADDYDTHEASAGEATDDELVLVCDSEDKTPAEIVAASREAAQTVQRRLEQFRHQVEELSAAKETLTQELAAAGSKQSDATRQFRIKDEELSQAQADLAKRQEVVTALERELSEKSTELAEAQRDLILLGQENAKSLEAERRKLKALEKEKKDLAKETAGRVEAQGRELEQLRQTVAAKEQEIAQATAATTKLNESLAAAQAKSVEAERRIATLETLRSQLAETVSRVAQEQAAESATLDEGTEFAEQVNSKCTELTETITAVDQGRKEQEDLTTAAQQLAGILKQQNRRILDRLHGTSDELATMRAAHEQGEKAIKSLRQENKKEKDKIAELKQLLKQSKAAINELKAREVAATQGLREEVDRLQQQLLNTSDPSPDDQRLKDRLAEQDERLAFLGRQVAELGRQVETTDREKTDLQRQLDALVGERIEISALQAKIQSLEEHNRTLLAAQGEEASHSGRVHQLVEEMKSVQDQRDRAKSRLRELEGQLAEQRSRTEGIVATRDKLREENERQVQLLKEQLAATRQAETQVRTQLRQREEEAAGLNAKLRTLTGDDSDTET